MENVKSVTSGIRLGVRLGEYEFCKVESGTAVITPGEKRKIFKNPREAAVYFAGAIESEALKRCLVCVDNWGYNIFTGEKN